MSIGDYLQTADWKKEKHEPVIECPETVAADEEFTVTLIIGKEIPHPNTTEHHIEWIQLFFKPEKGAFPYEVGKFDFRGHGAAVKGPNQGPLHTKPKVDVTVKINKSGTFMAMSLCNIHGLWESSKDIVVQ